MDTAIAQSVANNSLVNQEGIAGLPSRITQAIKNAAARTGVDFTYLMQKAAQESGFNATAKASGSSATGLYQFTSQTWLRMVKNYGAQYGLSSSANSITVDSNGTAHVADATMRASILAMRNDPQISAEMAGELDKENASSLANTVGGKIGATELYLAHFLGAGGASDFLKNMRANPKASAAAILPDAAAANPSVFYSSNGQPRSLSQIYQHFAQKFNGSAATYALASAGTSATTSPQVSSNYAAYQTANVGTTTPSGMVSSTAANLLPAINQLNAGGNSLVATMIMAQMSLGEVGSDAASSGVAAASSQHKKDALAMLGAVV